MTVSLAERGSVTKPKKKQNPQQTVKYYFVTTVKKKSKKVIFFFFQRRKKKYEKITHSLVLRAILTKREVETGKKNTPPLFLVRNKNWNSG